MRRMYITLEMGDKDFVDEEKLHEAGGDEVGINNVKAALEQMLTEYNVPEEFDYVVTVELLEEEEDEA